MIHSTQERSLADRIERRIELEKSFARARRTYRKNRIELWCDRHLVPRLRSPWMCTGSCRAARTTSQLSQYTWISWDDAANYLLSEKIDLDKALIYVNKSIESFRLVCAKEIARCG